MARKYFQLHVREQEDEDRKQELYRLLDLYKAQHRLRSAFDALAEIVENAMGSEQNK